MYLVEHEKKIYAMKKMNKLFILQEQQVTHVKCEKKILEKIQHAFIVKL